MRGGEKKTVCAIKKIQFHTCDLGPIHIITSMIT